MEYVRGSEWRRWDLHIHTPNTAKNDKYKGKTIEEKWNIFYNDINAYMGDGSTPDKNISVLGITDYLSIDNYKKVIFDNRLPESIKLILPNVEMRMIPVTKCTGINIHFIFDPSIVNQLDDLFFSRLSFKYGTKQINYSATRSQLIQLGKDIDSTLDDDEAYKKGVGQYIPTLDSIRKVFEENTWLREKTIIIVSNSSNDGVSSAVNHSDYLNGKSGSDLDAVRLAIYQFADMVFSANPSDIAYFLGEGENKDAPEIVIQKCGKLMPCVHGSDAHENSNIFEPKNKRYCWIKADPTFNGLRQVIYEPKDRVKISAIKPEEKQPYYVIDRIEIEDSDFQQTPIFFNDKLNCIIGGKSTGKSILLHNLALTVDKKQVLKKIQLTKSNYRIISGVKVYWNDGEVSTRFNEDDSHKIIYIPQTYLNRLSDEQEELTEIDKIIEEIIFLNNDVKNVYEFVENDIKTYRGILDKSIYDLLDIHNKLKEIMIEIKNLGTKNGIENHIEKLKQQKEQLSKDSCVSTADINRFDEVNTKEILLQNDIDKIQESIKFLSEINAIVEPINYNLPDQVSSWYHGISKTLLSRATEYWQLEKNKFLEIQKKKLSVIQSDFENNHKIKENLQNKISENEAIVKLTAQIQEEMEKYNKIVELEKIYENFSKEYHKFLEQVVSSKNFYKSKHEQYAKSINENKSLSVSDLDFSVSIPFRKEAFCDKIKQIIDNRTLKKKYNLDEWNEKKYSEEIYSLISSILSGELTLVKSYTMETALREIASDWYNTTYSVKMDQDDITVMSPGKKALVLLKLLISLANSKCPILIDQPEDDLDNRSIFDDLIPFIKSKKKDRQIIIVTHNANIVLGSDAEEVIVANQDGQNARNDIFRFEYRSGSIENDCALCEGDKIKKGILNKQGIQQHICDILEGGQKAFDLRKHKYRM